MNNQTVNNEENNRGRKTKKELEIALRSVWQGHVESNHDRWFWRPVY